MVSFPPKVIPVLVTGDQCKMFCENYTSCITEILMIQNMIGKPISLPVQRLDPVS